MSAMRNTAPGRVYSNAVHQFSARSNVAAVPGPGGADLDGTGFKTHQVWLVCVRGMGLTSMTEDGDERPFYKFINF